MDRKTIYLILFVFGAILPYIFFIQFILDNGIDVALFFELMLVNAISTMIIVDLVFSSLIFFVFMLTESKEKGISLMKVELSILATLSIGLSAGLPLYLYFREGAQHK